MDTYKNHLVIVFAIDHYNPLGAIRSLGENGINPVFIAINHRVGLGVKSKYVSKVYNVSSVQEGYDVLIENYGNYYLTSGEKPFILFSDDKSIGFFDNRYDELKDRFIIFNAKHLQGEITKFMDKKIILDIAKKHGLNILNSEVVKKGEMPKGLRYPLITKDINPNSGGWKSDVFICNNDEDLKDAYLKISSPIVLLQEFIDKKTEMAFEGCSVNGGRSVLIAIESIYKYCIPGYYSPYMDCSIPKDKNLVRILEELIEDIGYEGIFEIEFIIDKNDTPYFLEINFRNATWSYAATCAGMPLPYLYVKGMLEGYINKNKLEIKNNNFTAMVEPIDFGKRVDSGIIGIADWLSDFKEADCAFYYNKSDIEPFKVMCENFERLK